VLKYLRISATAFSLTACVLLIALWVRSYWRVDSLTYIHSINRVICGHSFPGRWIVLVTPKTIAHRPGLESYAITQHFDSGVPNSFLGFYYHTSPGATMLAIPCWFMVSSFAVLSVTAGFPWMPRRFSLRTVLIATTLVAVGLGVIVYASR
jgi:hypothetical protein